MSTKLYAYAGADVFDGTDLHKGATLLVEGSHVAGIVARDGVPPEAQLVELSGGTLAPGFVDLQVNGGDGVMFGDDPSLETLGRMARAHARLGATSILPTLITDTDDTTRRAVEAVAAACETGMGGIIGLHLEGPHLSLARKGAHDPGLIREMSAVDLTYLCDVAKRLPVLKITLAPESVTQSQMRALTGAGAILSLGHTDASFKQCVGAAGAGVSCVTHLFNAMHPLGSREPGVVGAALRLGALSAGLIGDLIHVHPQTILLALSAKRGPGQIFLVSDAMAVAGTDVGSFPLNGRLIERRNGRLTLEDGTLAGADLDLATAVHNLNDIGVPLERALAMATSIPAGVIGLDGNPGYLDPGCRADFVHLDATNRLSDSWCCGGRVDPE